MRLKIDLFTWAVIAIVIALVVAAVITVNVTNGAARTQTAQVAADSPAAPIVGAILALQQGDEVAARAFFTQETLDKYEEQGYDPIANSANFSTVDQAARRVRIVEISAPEADAAGVAGGEVAYVTIAEDNFGGGGLFGQSTWTNQRNIRVRRVDDVWKVDDTNFVY